jgi:hypothetical protein
MGRSALMTSVKEAATRVLGFLFYLRLGFDHFIASFPNICLPLLKMPPKPYSLTICIYVLLLYAFSIGATGQEIDWVNCSEHVPSPDIFNSTGVDLQHLPSTLKCGQLVVPMDYSKALTSTNNITLGLAMYRPAQPKGVIFV